MRYFPMLSMRNICFYPIFRNVSQCTPGVESVPPATYRSSLMKSPALDQIIRVKGDSRVHFPPESEFWINLIDRPVLDLFFSIDDCRHIMSYQHQTV